MSERTSYELSDGVATITLDDGKVNALSVEMLAAISAELDRAEADEAVVLLTGREKTFSAGFDLRTPLEGWPEMLAAGARLSERLLSFPQPTVIACNGNAIAMGAFTLLSADLRIGVGGRLPDRPQRGRDRHDDPLVRARDRQATASQRPYYDRCSVTGVLLDPAEAQTAGFLDRSSIRATSRPRARGRRRRSRASTARPTPRRRCASASTALEGIRDGIERVNRAPETGEAP